MVAIGDSEDGVPDQSQAAFSELLPLTEYAAYIHVNSYFGFYMPGASFFGRLSQFMCGLSESEPYMGYAEFTRQEGSEIDALLKLFGKNREKK